jgi:protein O-mannosyl-transferase
MKDRPADLGSPERCGKTAAGRTDAYAALPEFSPMKKWLFASALVAAVFLAYQSAWRAEFIWDDELHLLNNPVLKTGGLARAWAPGSYINYWPLTFTLYRLEFEIWGLDPSAFHFVNIALHAVTAILVWRVLVELDAPGAMVAAAIFALHPVCVESVAWIAQLKGLLSLLFALVSLLLYLRYDRRGGRRLYMGAVAAFCLSTLAKGMVITLPVVLLACAWWRRDSIARRDLLRVVPFVLIGATMAGVEIWTQQLVRADDIVRSDSLLSRAAVAGCAVWFYLGKLLLPLNLCFIYPRWQIDDGDVRSYLPGLLLVILFSLAFWRRRTWGRPVVMLLVCYVGLLLPALGFVNVYFMQYSLVADHWQYAAAIVPFAVLTGAATIWACRRFGRPPIACALGLMAVLAGLTWLHAGVYKDSLTLWDDTLAKNPSCWLAYNNVGAAFASQGQVGYAIDYYRKAVAINPDYFFAQNNLGIALASCGRFDEAIEHYRKALEIKPGSAEIHLNLGMALAGRGSHAEALEHFQKALSIASSRNDRALADTIRAQMRLAGGGD